MLVEGVKQYAIFMLNPEGIILTRNRGIQELLGYTRERFWVNQEKSFLVPPIGRRVAFKERTGASETRVDHEMSLDSHAAGRQHRDSMHASNGRWRRKQLVDSARSR